MLSSHSQERLTSNNTVNIAIKFKENLRYKHRKSVYAFLKAQIEMSNKIFSKNTDKLFMLGISYEYESNE